MNVGNSGSGMCQKSKMDLRALTMVGLCAIFAVSSTFVSAQSRSTEGATHASAHGRAVFALEDVKVILGLKDRVPSSEQEAEALGALNMKISPAHRKELTKQVKAIEKARQKLESSLNKDAAKRKEAIRKDRLSIQQSRLSSKTDNDIALGKNLFRNLLAEGNLAGQVAQKLSAFDNNHLFVIDYTEMAGTKSIRSIAIGKNVVINNNTLVAQAR